MRELKQGNPTDRVPANYTRGSGEAWPSSGKHKVLTAACWEKPSALKCFHPVYLKEPASVDLQGRCKSASSFRIVVQKMDAAPGAGCAWP